MLCFFLQENLCWVSTWISRGTTFVEASFILLYSTSPHSEQLFIKFWMPTSTFGKLSQIHSKILIDVRVSCTNESFSKHTFLCTNFTLHCNRSSDTSTLASAHWNTIVKFSKEAWNREIHIKLMSLVLRWVLLLTNFSPLFHFVSYSCSLSFIPSIFHFPEKI